MCRSEYLGLPLWACLGIPMFSLSSFLQPKFYNIWRNFGAGIALYMLKKSIGAVIDHFMYIKGNDTNPILMEMSHHILLNFYAIKANLKDAGREGAKVARIARNTAIVRASREGDLFMRPFDVVVLLARFRRSSHLAKAVQKMMEQDPENLPITLLRDWALLFLFLEGQGQRGGKCMNLMCSEFMEKIVDHHGSWIFSIKSHKTKESMGPAKIIVNDGLAKKLLNLYALRESELPRKSDFFFRTWGGVELQVMRSSIDILREQMLRAGFIDPYDKGLDTLTTGAVRKSFATLGQRVPGLKDRLAWAMSHSSETAKGIYTVDQDHRVSIETNRMVNEVLSKILDNGAYLESLKTNTEGLNWAHGIENDEENVQPPAPHPQVSN
ncbi:uncharacterized protein [Lepeophtheirus salmonis]|uniref:uncharacterized protein isoform X2 n=1 Tax=Lepeophtheirus salmonis TaxID=72036 RepID=UPI001AE6D746|nr:uncharacterized protein LOC121130911 [Lepeophtheirus salmonis]